MCYHYLVDKVGSKVKITIPSLSASQLPVFIDWLRGTPQNALTLGSLHMHSWLAIFSGAEGE